MLIGASGGISAIIAFYALAFPRARLKLFFSSLRPGVHAGSLLPPMFWFSFRVRYAVAFWVLIQLVLLLEQLEGRTNISAAAHLGGFIICYTAWWLGRPRP